MNSFETYYMRYALCGENPMVEKLPERRGKIKSSIPRIIESDLNNGEFNLTVEAVDESSYRIIEESSTEEKIISNSEEAKEFALSFAEPFINFFEEA